MSSKLAVGMPIDRADGKLKVTGRARFSAEMPLPGLVHGVLVESTVANGTLTSINTVDAEKAPGVLAIITVDNVKPSAPNQSIFIGKTIHYSGQHIGIVVAETYEQAFHAAALVKAEYETQPPVADMEQHLDAAIDPPQGGRNTHSKRGDIDKGASGAKQKLHQIYRTPIVHHNPMEPHATTAVWDADKLTVYESTQGIFGTQNTLMRLFALPKNKVRVVSYFIGGGFGCKGQTWHHTGITAYAARQVQRPVRLALERRQMFTSNGHRPTTRQEITLGASDDGKLVALRQDARTSSSTAADFVEPVGSVPSMLYSCPNLDVGQKIVRLTVGQPTYMRAPGESSGSFGIETAMDELAYQLGINPLELRLRNYAETDESTGHPWSTKSLRQCYLQAASAFGWSRRSHEPRSMRKGKTLIGYGMASATYPANQQPSSANARMFPDGSVLVTCGTQDIGTGTYTILAQIAADNLGVPVGKVRVELGDTDFPPGPHSGGSTTAASAGSSVKPAALALKSTLIRMAIADPKSPLYNADEKAVLVQDGTLTAGGGPRSESYIDVLQRSGQKTVDGKASAQASQNPAQPYSKHSFGAHFAEVHVDEDLGTVRVVRYQGAFAGGKILNAKTALSQFRGGIVWGISMALFEESMLDPNYGRFVNTNLAEYHVATNADIPDIQVIMVPEDDPYVNAIGVKGIGEIGIVGGAAAVGNAVFHATGKRVRDLPITLDKLL